MNTCKLNSEKKTSDSTNTLKLKHLKRMENFKMISLSFNAKYLQK